MTGPAARDPISECWLRLSIRFQKMPSCSTERTPDAFCDFYVKCYSAGLQYVQSSERSDSKRYTNRGRSGAAVWCARVKLLSAALSHNLLFPVFQAIERDHAW